MGDHKGGARGVLRQVVTGQLPPFEALDRIAPDFIGRRPRIDALDEVAGRFSYERALPWLAGEESNPSDFSSSLLAEEMFPVRAFVDRSISRQTKEKQDAILSKQANALLSEFMRGYRTQGYRPGERPRTGRDLYDEIGLPSMETPGFVQSIENAIRRRTISFKAANRLMGSMKKALSIMDDDPRWQGADPELKSTARQLISRLGGIASLRTQIYDMDAVSSTDGRFTGRFGNRLQEASSRAQREAIQIANAINRAVGDNTPPDGDGFPARGTLGHKMYQTVVAANAAIGYNSAQKMRRTNKSKVALVNRYLVGQE